MKQTEKERIVALESALAEEKEDNWLNVAGSSMQIKRLEAELATVEGLFGAANAKWLAAEKAVRHEQGKYNWLWNVLMQYREHQMEEKAGD